MTPDTHLQLRGTRPRPAGSQPEMVQRVARHDWSKTPLGPMEHWPQSLRTAAHMTLHSRFPLWIGWGPDLVMIYNDGFKEILQAKHPWALGRPTREIWHEVWDVIGPMLHSVLETGQATWSNDELLVLERSGVPEETYFTWSYSPIEGDDGRIGGILTTVKETTDRVLGERRMRALRDLGLQSEPTVDAAVERAVATFADNRADLPVSAVYLLDGDVLRRRGLTGVAEHDALPAALPARKATAPWPTEQVLASGEAAVVDVAELLLPGGPWDMHVRQAVVLPMTTPAGPVGMMVAAVSPMRPLDADYRTFLELAAKHLATAIGNAKALQEERARTEALVALDKAKTEFFSNISHEFRTPLTLMLGPLQDTLRAPGLDAAHRDQLEIAERNSRRLLKLVNNLLDFSRLEAGRMQASFVPVPFGPFVADLASGFRSAAQRADLRLTIDCPATPDPVYLDRDMWERIVLNLMSNALKFTFQGGITVRSRAEARHMVLEVSDTGVGVPQEELPRLFERFHRVEGTRSRTHEGTGIGLSLVQELVKLHGGQIEAHSVHGQGTTFRIRVPLGHAHLPPKQVRHVPGEAAAPGRQQATYVDEAERWLDPTHVQEEMEPPAADTRPAPSEEAMAPAALLPRPRVLLADDNADMRDYLRRILAKRWDIVTAGDGEEAYAECRRQRPDLVLSDVMMPRLDGFGLLRRLRSDPRLRAVPVILLSARAGEEARVEGLEHGADDYLTKPFTLREVVARVNTHLELGRARRQAIEVERNARRELERLTGELEARVQEQTAALRERARTLEAANASLSGMSYIVGHDLQEPVRAVGSILHVLRVDNGPGLPAPVRELLAQAEKANERLGRLVAGLVDLGRAANTPLDDAQTARVLDLLQDPAYDAPAKRLVAQHHVAYTVAGTDLPLHVPVRDAARVLLNIVRNAIHHNPGPDRKVHVSAHEVEQDGLRRTLVCVEDNGPGFRAETIAEFNNGGLGTREGRFGLAICKRVVERMGGKLVLDRSERWGGAFVHLHLPASPPGEPGLTHRILGLLGPEPAPGTEQYASLLRSIPGAFFRCETAPPWRFSIMTNQVMALTGYPASDFTDKGRTWASIMHPDDVDRVAAAVEPHLADGTPYNVEYRVLHADGSVRWLLDRGSGIYDDAGNNVAIEGLVFDITSIKRTEQELRESQERYRETSEDLLTFTNTVTHDLRAPVRATDYYLSRLRKELDKAGRPDLVELAVTAAHENQRGTRLLNDLLGFSRGANKPLERSAVDASAIAASVRDDLAAHEGFEHVGWTIRPGLEAYADGGLLRILLQTLMHNAAKYAGGRASPQVRVEGEVRPDGTLLRVSDNGIGFPQQEAERLFQPFTRLSTASEFEGTGLGLATAKRIATRHGGTIAARSAPGEGATFEVFLPAKATGTANPS